jgi:hypothetical protein
MFSRKVPNQVSTDTKQRHREAKTSTPSLHVIKSTEIFRHFHYVAFSSMYIKYKETKCCLLTINKQMHLYKQAQSLIIILHQHVSVNFCDNNHGVLQ